ncbi:hypothetical protein V1511DRAFT_500334 [Dipodascopsis uninucleata]
MIMASSSVPSRAKASRPRRVLQLQQGERRFSTPQNSSEKRSKHLTFDEDQSDDINGADLDDRTAPDTPMAGYVTAEESLASEDDDDDAPEDVSFKGSKQQVKALEAQKNEIIQAVIESVKAKREAQNEFLKKQKIQRGARKGEEQTQDGQSSASSQNLPLLLPSSILSQVTTNLDESLEQADDAKVESSLKRPKKIVFNEPEVRDYKKGDVTLRVLKAQKVKTMAPPATRKVVKSRDKWLKRKTVRNIQKSKITI